MAKRKASKPLEAPKAPVRAAAKQSAGTKRKSNDAAHPTPQKPAKAVKQEMQDCDICAESKPLYRHFPHVQSCDHDPTVCSDCYKTHFVTRIDADRALGWLACNCPLCAESVSEEDARGILPRTLSRELDRTIQQTQISAAINWLWCPAEGCGHGELHPLTRKPFVCCSTCKTKICFNHQCRWHKGMTCHEFDEMRNKDEAAKKDMDEIRRTTKPCPFCKMRVKKEGGCNHMTCVSCRKHWLWNNVPFDGEQQGDSAEILGGPRGADSLGGEARHAVEQVMRFENAQIDNPRRPLPLDGPLALPQLAPQEHNTDITAIILQRVTQVIQMVFGNEGRSLPPPHSLPPPVPVRNGLNRARELVPRPAPVSAVRSTLPQPQAQTDAVIVADDDPAIVASDEQMAQTLPRPVYQLRRPGVRAALQAAQRRRARPETWPAHQVVDLTSEEDDDEGTDRVAIDLTRDD